MLLVYFGKQRRIGATFPKMFTVGQGWEISFWGHIFCISGHATTQRGAMEITNQTQLTTRLQPRAQPQPRPQHLTAVTLVSAKRTINWVILQTRRTAASKGKMQKKKRTLFILWVNNVHFFYTFTYNNAIIKVTGETPKVRSDKRSTLSL